MIFQLLYDTYCYHQVKTVYMQKIEVLKIEAHQLVLSYNPLSSQGC